MRATLAQTSHTALTMCTENLTVLHDYNSQLNRRVVHPMRVTNLRNNHVFISENLPENVDYETGDHLVVGLQAFKVLKLFFRVKTRLQHQIRYEVNSFNRRKTFRTQLFVRNKKRINTNTTYFINLTLLYNAVE